MDNTNFKCVIVGNKYVVSLHFISLPEYIFFLDLINDIDKTIDYDMSVYIKKLDTYKVLNDITYTIGLFESERHTIKGNQNNIDILNESSKEAKELRRKIQIENQEIFNVNIILTFYSEDLTALYKSVSSFKARLYSKNFISEITNFRHLNYYLSNLPLQNNSNYNIFLTSSALANIFPYISNNFIDINGVLIGYTKMDNKICILDIFSDKYENSNVCIFGSSGSGKSYFVKLNIIRNFFKNIKQIVLDIEGEYINICHSLKGQSISNGNYFNILQITKKDVENIDNTSNYLQEKIEKVVSFLVDVCQIKNIYKEYLKIKLQEIYNKFNITNDVSTIFKTEDNNHIYLENVFIDNYKFPTLNDLLNIVEDYKLKNDLKSKIENEIEFFSNKTNISLENNLYVIDTNYLKNNTKIISYILDNIVSSYLKEKNTIIYIDEMWKYAQSKELLLSISNMYKTIRKRKASIVTITQDINDFFTYDNGIYAKSILNNSSFKLIFKMTYKDTENLNKFVDLSDFNVDNLQKGEAILSISNNKAPIIILANEYERILLNENDNSNK